MKCFYHRDMDGKCAGAIVYKFFKLDRDYTKEIGEPCEFISIDYKDAFPFEKITPNETVVIVDFSLQKEGEFQRLLSITDKVIWIDHHKTAIEKHGDIDVTGIRRDGVAGCVLTWQYFYPNIELPRIVDMLGAYDIWDFSKYGNDLNKLQTGIRLFNTSPESDKWRGWLNTKREGQEIDGAGFIMDGLTSLLEMGGIALQYRDNQYASLIKAWSFEAYFHGYKAICCNAGSVSSQLFDSVKEDYVLMITFVFDGKQWTVSLYTKKDIDVSAIAKIYGGGGHKQAAGFQCKELPFIRTE